VGADSILGCGNAILLDALISHNLSFRVGADSILGCGKAILLPADT